MNGPILNVADAAFHDWGNGAGIEARIGGIGAAIGAKLLGCSAYIVRPGKRSAPHHHHYANEELFVILAGTGEFWIGKTAHPIRPGDVIACPPGGPETAHHMRNTGSEELRYLALSTKLQPEVVGYPDSGKFLARAEAVDAEGKAQTVRHIGRAADQIDYWDGEGG